GTRQFDIKKCLYILFYCQAPHIQIQWPVQGRLFTRSRSKMFGINTAAPLHHVAEATFFKRLLYTWRRYHYSLGWAMKPFKPAIGKRQRKMKAGTQIFRKARVISTGEIKTVR